MNTDIQTTAMDLQKELEMDKRQQSSKLTKRRALTIGVAGLIVAGVVCMSASSWRVRLGGDTLQPENEAGDYARTPRLVPPVKIKESFKRHPTRWTIRDIQLWYAQQPWLVGNNFIPSTAVNELEMWQKDTFDLATLDRELNWVQQLGMNMVRVFLHYIPWQDDRNGFFERMDQFLRLTEKYKIGVMFVLFDDNWKPTPRSGPQPAPTPHVHNSQWLQCPGVAGLLNTTFQDTVLYNYVSDIISRWGADPRISVWDVYNEPSAISGEWPDDPHLPNKTYKTQLSLVLLKKVFKWTRAMQPIQPLTCAIWGTVDPNNELQTVQIENSDFITFHEYGPLASFSTVHQNYVQFERPIVCTEYMDRPTSTFQTIMPYGKVHNVGLINWGFVAGKTQTNYPWDSWHVNYTAPPDPWFHDILNPDGTAYRQEEVDFIRSITSGKYEIHNYTVVGSWSYYTVVEVS